MPKLNVIVGDETFENWGPRTVLQSEGVAIEKAYGKTFAQFVEDIDSGSIYAKQVLAWSLLRRSDPGLKVGEVDLPIGDVRLATVCDHCGKEVVSVAQEVDGNNMIERFHIEDASPECTGDEATGDPFTSGSPSAGQDSSTSDEPTTSETSPTSSESDPGNGDS